MNKSKFPSYWLQFSIVTWYRRNARITLTFDRNHCLYTIGRGFKRQLICDLKDKLCTSSNSKKFIKISSANWGSSHLTLISMYDKQIMSRKSLTCLAFFHQRFSGIFFAKHRRFDPLEQEPEVVKRYYLFCCLESGIRYENHWSLKIRSSKQRFCVTLKTWNPNQTDPQFYLAGTQCLYDF